MNWSWSLGLTVLLIVSLTLKRGHYTNRLNRFDLVLGTSLGIVFALISTFWLSQFHTLYPILESDFFEYCTGVSAIDILPNGLSFIGDEDSSGLALPKFISLPDGFSPKRSALPMVLPQLFYDKLGIFDALAVAGIVSSGLLGTTLYFWGRIIAGPMAGLAAGLLGMTLGPLTLYTRTITSYPEMSLCFVIAAASTAYGVVSKKRMATVWASIGIGLALLADVRGLFWAVPLAGTLLISIAFRGRFKTKIIRFVIFTVILAISFQLGESVYVPNSLGFQEQVDIRPMFYRFLGEQSGFEPAYQYSNPWVWGRHSPLNIIDTAQFLLAQSTIEPPGELLTRPEVAIGRKLAWRYLGLCGVAGAAALWVCRRKFWNFVALAGSVCPFVVALYGNTSLLENHSRFYLQTLPGLALLMGVGFILFIPNGVIRIRHFFTAIVLLFAIIFGVLPTPLSPNGGWQLRWKESPGHLMSTINDYRADMEKYKQGQKIDPNFRHCRSALRRIEIQNKPFTVSFYEN